ncbi:MAG: hypothetical protein FWC79_02385 [Oscillospiraceae bacterium]|nr:hypothetical protein [Oscillospiraceae bacterium]
MNFFDRLFGRIPKRIADKSELEKFYEYIGRVRTPRKAIRILKDLSLSGRNMRFKDVYSRLSDDIMRDPRMF